MILTTCLAPRVPSAKRLPLCWIFLGNCNLTPPGIKLPLQPSCSFLPIRLVFRFRPIFPRRTACRKRSNPNGAQEHHRYSAPTKGCFRLAAAKGIKRTYRSLNRRNPGEREREENAQRTSSSAMAARSERNERGLTALSRSAVSPKPFAYYLPVVLLRVR